MFVGIEDFKGAIAIENILTPYKKGRLSHDKKTRLPKEKITPDICMEILKSTNYARNIKDMLRCIADLPVSEQAIFKDVVLSSFDNREQPEPIIQLGRELAEKSGYGIEFAKAQKFNEGEYLLSNSNPRMLYVSLKDSFSDEDFSMYEKLICLSDKVINFERTVKLPAIVDVSNSSEVNWVKCNLKNVSQVLFKDNAKVNWSEVRNLPPELDFSMCSEVKFNKCNLFKFDDLRFKDGAVVKFYLAKELPKNLDVSRCADVDLGGCDLAGMDNLHFRDGAKVNLGSARNLPENLDVSNCSEIKLFWCDLSGISNLRFKDGAKVDLNEAYNLPKNLDVSRCADVDLDGCNLSAVKELVFKNRQQMEKSSAKLPDDWKGKLVFADEQEPPALGLAMSAKAKGGR